MGETLGWVEEVTASYVHLGVSFAQIVAQLLNSRDSVLQS